MQKITDTSKSNESSRIIDLFVMVKVIKINKKIMVVLFLDINLVN